MSWLRRLLHDFEMDVEKTTSIFGKALNAAQAVIKSAQGKCCREVGIHQGKESFVKLGHERLVLVAYVCRKAEGAGSLCKTHDCTYSNHFPNHFHIQGNRAASHTSMHSYSWTYYICVYRVALSLYYGSRRFEDPQPGRISPRAVK